MIIAGGIYEEHCRYPRWDHLYGSGLRAAVALSSLSPKIELHSYAAEAWKDDIVATLNSFGVKHALKTIPKGGAFHYLHPFELVHHVPFSDQHDALKVEGDVVLRFGMVEGDAQVNGDRVVYDPQSPAPKQFAANGSKANHLAMILGRSDLLHFADIKKDDNRSLEELVREAASNLNDTQLVQKPVLVVKDGVGGATVFVGDEPVAVVPTYAAESYFRIGAGDVFAAAFAHAWGERKLIAAAAADFAARCSAYFVDGPRLPLPFDEKLLPQRKLGPAANKKVRILGVGALELENLLLHTCAWLQQFDYDPVIELFDGATPCDADAPLLYVIGSGEPDENICKRIQESNSYVHRVVYWPNMPPQDVAELFPGMRITDDYATALYYTLRVPVE